MWWQLPSILSWSLTHFLQQQGLASVSVQIDDVGFSRGSISQFQATYHAADTSLHVQLEDVRFAYTVSQLMTGEVASLIVDSAALKIDKHSSQQDNAATRLPSFDQILSAYKAVNPDGFPLREAQLNNVLISHNLVSESVNVFETVELSAAFSKHADSFNGKLKFANKQEVDWTGDSQGGWDVKYYEAPTQPTNTQGSVEQIAAFNGQLKHIDQSLQFSIKLQSALLQRWLTIAGQSALVSELSEISLNGTIKADDTTSDLVIISTIYTQNLGYQDWTAQDINAHFDIQIKQAFLDQSKGSWQFDVLSNNDVSVKSLNMVDWEIDNIAFSSIADIGFKDSLTKVNLSDIQFKLAQLQQANNLVLSDYQFAGQASFLLEPDQWQFDMLENWQMSSRYARLNDTEFPQGWASSSSQPLRFKGVFQAPPQETSQVTTNDNETISGVINDLHGSIILEHALLDITIPIVQDNTLAQNVILDKVTLQINQLSSKQDGITVFGELLIPSLTIENINAELSVDDNEHQNDWRLTNIRQQFELNGDLLKSNGSADVIERDLHIETISKHDFKQQQGDTQFQFKLLEFNDPNRLAALISPLTLPINLVTGEVELSGKVIWQNKNDQWGVTVSIDTQLKNLGGAYEAIFFSGVHGQLSMQVYPHISSESLLRLNAEHIDAGVANKDIIIDFKLRPSNLGALPIIDIQHAQTQLLKGSITLKPTAYDLNSEQNILQLVIENIDLNELITLQQLDDLEATGLLNGELPVIINNNQISIDKGQLQAIPPGGIIRYQANADALQSNEYAKTVILVLKDFHYDVLRADTQYMSDGDLLLNLQLQGKNPNFEQGRQVNLNINLEQNVIKLLESLRLFDGISDNLDERVRDYYQQTTSQ